MEAREQLLGRLQAMSDQAFLGRDESAVAALPRQALRLSFHGLLLGAPRGVAANGHPNHPAIPGLLLTALSGKRSTMVPWHPNAMLVATDLEHGTVYAEAAFQGNAEKSPDSAPQPPPQAVPEPDDEDQALLDELGDGNTAGLAWFDFGKLLRLPSRPAHFVLRTLYFDQVSNRVLVEVKAPGPAAAPLSADAARTLVARVRAAGQSHGLPRFFPSAETPALKGPGVALALGKPMVSGAERIVPAHGVLRLVANPGMLVQKDAVGAQPDAHGRNPHAVLRATVLVVMKDRATPLRMPLEIPVWLDRELHSGELVEAAFSVDLSTVLPPRAPAGPYQVYLLGGPYLSGPHALMLGP